MEKSLALTDKAVHSTHRWNASTILPIGHTLEEIWRLCARIQVQECKSTGDGVHNNGNVLNTAQL